MDVDLTPLFLPLNRYGIAYLVLLESIFEEVLFVTTPSASAVKSFLIVSTCKYVKCL